MGTSSGLQPVERGKHMTSSGQISRHQAAMGHVTSAALHCRELSHIFCTEGGERQQVSPVPCCISVTVEERMKTNSGCHTHINLVLVPFATKKQIKRNNGGTQRHTAS